MTNNTSGDRLRTVRQKLGLSQSDFGKPIGMGRGEVANIEYGLTEIKEVKIPLICNVYGISETWLRTGEGEMMTATSSGDRYGEIIAGATKQDIAKAKKFFGAMFDGWDPEEIILLYEILRKKFPQFDKKED